MVSSPGALEDLLQEKEKLLEEMCRLFESALVAAEEGDLEGAAAPVPQTERLLARLLEVDHRIPPGRSTARADRLLGRAKGLHTSLLSALEGRRADLAEKIRSARTFRRMLKGYRRPAPSTGRRLDVTDR